MMAWTPSTAPLCQCGVRIDHAALIAPPARARTTFVLIDRQGDDSADSLLRASHRGGTQGIGGFLRRGRGPLSVAAS
jgi:hypothetical protein